jgi:hypothetical protein
MTRIQFVPQASESVIDRPICGDCGAEMWLACIEPEKPDHNRRTFEFRRCQGQVTKGVKFR